MVSRGSWSSSSFGESAESRVVHSERTLLRRFKDVTGVGPVQYVQQLRVDRAKALLESTLLSLEEIAGRCGYQDASTLHKVFTRWAHVTPGAYRTRFGLRG